MSSSISRLTISGNQDFEDWESLPVVDTLELFDILDCVMIHTFQ